MPRNSSTAPFARPRTGPLAVPTTGPRTPAAACPPRVLALAAGAAATRAPRVTPAAASRVRACHPVQVLNIGVSLHVPRLLRSELLARELSFQPAQLSRECLRTPTSLHI